MNLFVANISKQVSSDSLRSLFSQLGEVTFVRIMIDRQNGESRGFAFVEMPDDREAMDAIRSLANFDFFGQRLAVSKAKPKGSY